MADLTLIHNQNAGWIHIYSTFYPWHRAYLKVYEDALCFEGYCGGLPYLNWLDIPTSEMSIWSSFGTITYNQEVCLTDGAFSNPSLSASGYLTSDGQCLKRCGANPNQLIDTSASLKKYLQSKKNYEEFNLDDMGGYHGAGHIFFGGKCVMASGGN